MDIIVKIVTGLTEIDLSEYSIEDWALLIFSIISAIVVLIYFATKE